jgi:hypothetical protein
MLVQKGELTEKQLKKIIEIVDVEKLVKHNKLSPEFIDKYVKPKIEENGEEYDSMTMYDVYQIQNYKKNSNN